MEPQKSTSRLRRRESLTTQLVRQITDRISNGEYKPGDRLPSEQEFCDAYGVSRSVVREAISGLRAEGLIATRHGVGAFVLEPPPRNVFHIEEKEMETLQEVIHVLDLRICVEAEAAKMAAKLRTPEQLEAIRDALVLLLAGADGRDPGVNADFQFHQAIAAATQNRYFIEILGFLSGMVMPRLRVDLFKDDETGRQAYVQSVNREHENIYRAIAESDGERAAFLMREHLSRSRDRLQHVVNSEKQ